MPLASHILLTALSVTMKTSCLSGLEKLMVKEVYYGDYTLVTDDENPPERQATGPDKNGVYKVSFENELTGKTHNGGVVNKYEQDGDSFKRVSPQADTNRQTHHR